MSWLPPGSSPGSVGTQSAVRILVRFFGMDDVHEGLLDGEVRGEAAFVHADVLAHEVERGAVVAADRAAVHERPRVRLQVALDGRAAAEELVAHLALVRLLARVDPPMVVELTRVGKPFATHLAAILAVPRLTLQRQLLAQELLCWQLPLLESWVLEPKARPWVKATVALVLADVVAIGSLRLEALAAQVAVEEGVFQALVHSHVLLQEMPVHKAICTHGAREDRDA